MTPTRRRLVALAGALALLTAACGGTPTRPIGIKEYPGDVVFGDQAAPPTPTVPPFAEPAPAFPGFIVPPAPRQLAGDPGLTVPASSGPTTTVRPAACPEDDPLAVPEREAFVSVTARPKAQTIPYRVRGTVTAAGTTLPLPVEATHRVGAPTNIGDPSVFRFDVAVRQGADETVTTYQVDQRSGGAAVSGTANNPTVAADSVSIVQIRSASQVATDAFTPSAPIRILPLPPVRGDRFSGTGTDPLHGTSMTVFGLIRGKTRVNACGTPLEAWLVEVGADPQTGQPSSIRSPDKNLVITGTYAVATQFGGLIIADDLTLTGTDRGRQVTIKQSSTTNRVPLV